MDGGGDELKVLEVEDAKPGSLVIGLEVATTLTSSAVTAADVGDADELKGPEVAGVAMTVASSASTAADVREGEADELKAPEVEDGKAVGGKRNSKVSLLLLMVNGEQALSLKPRASDTELVTHVCSSGLP